MNALSELNKRGAKTPEANIQAEFYRYCVMAGVEVVLELTTPIGRLDAVIFNKEGTELAAIVECKSNAIGEVKRTKQIERYKRIGVPVYGLARIDKAERLVKSIQSQCFKPDSVRVGLGDVLAMDRLKKRRRRTTAEDRVRFFADEELNIRG